MISGSATPKPEPTSATQGNEAETIRFWALTAPRRETASEPAPVPGGAGIAGVGITGTEPGAEPGAAPTGLMTLLPVAGHVP